MWLSILDVVGITGQLLGRKNCLPQSISKAKVEELSITTVASNPGRKLRTLERLKKNHMLKIRKEGL